MTKKLSALEQRLADLKQKHDKEQKQIKAQIRDAQAREKAAARKVDTRRKILAGAFMLHHCAVNPQSELSKKLFALLDEYLIKDIDRDLFDMQPIPKDEQESRRISQRDERRKAEANFAASVK